MPFADFGENISFGVHQYLKLKDKKDKVQFRILGKPYFEGKHFMKDDKGNWDVKPCPRVDENAECDLCKTYFSIIAAGKKTNDKTLMEQAKKEAKPFQNAVSVYYPIINRETGEYAVFQTTWGVRNMLEAEVELGVKVMKVDWIVLRTEVPGSYYKLSRVDSAETKALTKEEKEIVKQYKDGHLAEAIGGTADEAGVAVEANSEIEE